LTPTPTPSFVPPLDPDAVAFFDAITASGGTLNSTEETAINDLVVDLKAYSLWNKMIGLYPVVGGTAITQAFNLKDPSQYNLLWQTADGGVFGHSSAGVAPPGDLSWAWTSINPSLVGMSGSAHMAIYVTENGGGGYDMGLSESGRDWALIASYSNNTYYARFGGTSGYITTSNPTQKHFYINTNIDGTTTKGYRNGVEVMSGADTLTAWNRVMTISAINDINSAQPVQGTTRDWALASIGLGMDATEASNYNTAVVAFQTALSRQN
jgi:hypothetical protein